jgi:hypothetical protein
VPALADSWIPGQARNDDIYVYPIQRKGLPVVVSVKTITFIGEIVEPGGQP